MSTTPRESTKPRRQRGGAAVKGGDIRLTGVSKRFPDGTLAVAAVDLEIREGEFVTFVGPSGSGKTTLLRMIGGLEEITEGTIEIGGRVVNDLAPKQRDIAMVFQDFALYPNMTVHQNMEFALRIQRLPKESRNERVRSAARMLGISDLLKRLPRQLSGGQRQRVAMGRAIVREPRAFLMDEPLSNLDAKLRVHMREEISRLHQRLRTTTVYVTHDQIEAMTMAERIVVLRDGRVMQIGSPQELYDAPANVFVAGFIGSPAMNLVKGRLEAGADDRQEVVLGGHHIPLPPAALARRPGLAAHVGREVIAGIRPEHLEDTQFVDATRTWHTFEVDVVLVERLGSETVATFEIDAPPVLTSDIRDLLADVDDAGAELITSRATIAARLEAKSGVRPGASHTLSVDTGQLYFFDPETQAAIG